MSQRGRRRVQQSASQPSTSREVPHVDDDDDHHSRAQSQRSQSPNRSLSNQEHAHHVANAVRYILSADHSKTPINRATISKAIECHAATFRAVMTTVEEVLQDVFGYKMVNLENGGKFILCNMIEDSLPHMSHNKEVKDHYVLLFLILAHIYMNGEICTEASVIKFLTKLDIIIDGNMEHKLFGNVLHLITVEFVKERYLHVSISENNENQERELSWGERAKAELSVRTVMEFVGKIYGERDIQSWPQQYESMLRKEEEQRNGRRNGIVQNGTA